MICNLQHFALAVPDVEAGRRFYETFGLESEARGNRLAPSRCAGRAQDQVLLSEGPKRRLHHIGFGTDAAGLASAKTRLEAAGVRLLDPPGEDMPDGLWFHDPDGNLVNLQIADSAPASATPGGRMNSPGDFRRLGARGAPVRGTKARPRRLGQRVLLFSPDVPRATAFYRDILGMRVSDTVGGHILAFLRTAGDSDHHVLAFARSDRTGFHHASSEVGSPDEIKMACRAGGGGRLPQRLGHGPPCRRLQFLPLPARSLERHGGIFLGHRLRAGCRDLGCAGLGSGGRLLPLEHRRPAAG